MLLGQSLCSIQMSGSSRSMLGLHLRWPFYSFQSLQCWKLFLLGYIYVRCNENPSVSAFFLFFSVFILFEWISMFCWFRCTTAENLVTTQHLLTLPSVTYMQTSKCMAKQMAWTQVNTMQWCFNVHNPQFVKNLKETMTLATHKWLRRNVRDCDILFLFHQ